jgi:hypothetical protein
MPFQSTECKRRCSLFTCVPEPSAICRVHVNIISLRNPKNLEFGTPYNIPECFLESVHCEQVTGLDALQRKLAGVETATAADDFWEDQERAQAVLHQISTLKHAIGEVETLRGFVEDAQTAVQLAEVGFLLVADSLRLRNSSLKITVCMYLHC